MYIFKKALAVKKEMGSKWGEVDIRLMTMSYLKTTYRKMYITLENTFLTDILFIDFDEIVKKYPDYIKTFSELLVDIGDEALPTTIIPPVLNPKYVIYTDAYRAGYKIESAKIGVGDDVPINREDKVDIKITRNNPDTNMRLFYETCLVSVNGFFHKCDTDGQYVYVKDGSKSMFRANKNQLGITSFGRIGKIETHSITPSMLKKVDTNTALKSRCLIELPKVPENKTVLLVIGGYLLFPEPNNFWLSGDKMITLSLSTQPIIERYFESQQYLNFSALGLPTSSVNPSLINIDEFLSDDVVTKYLTIPQSFIVIVDTPQLFVNKLHIRNSRLPGMFVSHKDPIYPLFVNNGMLAEYWKTYEDHQWSVTVTDSHLQNKVFSSRPIGELPICSDSNEPARRIYHSKGWMLEIGRDF